MLIDVALQEFTVTAASFSSTALLPCDAPNPDPEIATCVPASPLFGVTDVMLGAGAAAVLIDTLSKLAVASAALSFALTARPIYTLCAMLIFKLPPSCVQVTPSAEEYPLNVLPLRTSFTHRGRATMLLVEKEVPAPVLGRSYKYIEGPGYGS